MTQSALIIGAGIVGVSTALSLARRGWNVKVVEKNLAVGCGSTARTSSVIRCHYTRAEAIALAHEGATLWADWANYLKLENVRARYHATGVLFLMRQGIGGPPSESLGVKAEMDQNDLDERLRMMQSAGVSATLMGPQALSEHLPCFQFPEDDVVGIWEPNSGFVYPPVASVQDLEEAAMQMGVEFHFQTTVKGGQSDWVNERRVLRRVQIQKDDTLTTLSVDAVVNCAGPASHEVNIAFDCPLSISTAPQRQFIVEATWANPVKNIPAMADLSTGFYIRPHHEVFKVGAALAMDHVTFSMDSAPEQTRIAKDMFEKRVLNSLRMRAPDIQLKDVETKIAFYDWSVSDSYPIIDVTDVGGYFVAIGTSGAWFKSGPVIGEMMAERISRESVGNKDNNFKLAYTGNTIELNAFSVGKRLLT